MARLSFMGPTEEEQIEMLAALNLTSIDELYDNIVPQEQQYNGNFHFIEPGLSEPEVRRVIEALAKKNFEIDPAYSFLGAGRYQRIIPAIVKDLVMDGRRLTPYTPYQPEVSQGVLMDLFEYQRYMARLADMDVVNAGMYNGENALVEGALMACRLTGKNKIAVSDAVNPIAIANMKTYFRPKGIELVSIPIEDGLTTSRDIEKYADVETAAVIVQNPNFWGLFDGLDNHAEAVHSKGALYIMYGGGDQLSLVKTKTPGEAGADIYAGEGQHLGVPLGYGGPHVGILGMKNADKSNIRQLPGRLVLQAEDAEGKVAYRLGLQTREQHIRRERATSNACTTETLISAQNVIYFASMGNEGVNQAWNNSYELAHYLAQNIAAIPGYEIVHTGHFFDEFAVRTPKAAYDIFRNLTFHGVQPGVPVAKMFPYTQIDPNVLLLAATEVNALGNPDRLLNGLEYAATR